MKVFTMDTKEFAQSFVDAYNAGDTAQVASHLVDDFKFSGPVPKPIGSKEWLGLHSIFKAAFPDISYNLRGVIGMLTQLGLQTVRK